MKIKQANYVTNHTDMIYVEHETELSWLIRLGMVCDENQTG